MIEIFILGNVNTKRTEAELTLRAGSDEKVIGIVFDNDVDWDIDIYDADFAHQYRAELDAATVSAKARLTHYPNRTGENPPTGINVAALSLWLLTKDDGTALGEKVI